MNKRSIASHLYRMIAVVVLFALILGTAPAWVVHSAPGIRYAKPGGLTSGICDSWENACELQYTLGLAASGEELWAEQGTYKPTTGNDRYATFQLKTGVVIYGGFAGTETAREQRNWAANITVLSGDIGVVGDNSDNSYHVVNGSSTDNTAVLDGFTITGGNASGSGPYSGGGGMYNSFGSPSLANLTFDSNSAGDGGGMYNYYSNHTLANVVFIGNSATDEANGHGGAIFNQDSTITLTAVTFNGNSGIYGGGMYNGSSSPILEAVTFIGNSAVNHGGGVYNYISNSIMTDVIFIGNSASTGGGMINNVSNPILTSVTISDNSAIDWGGGIFNYDSSPSLANVIFDSNSASFGGGMSNYNSSPSLANVTFSNNSVANQGGGMYDDGSSPTVYNSILWDNNPDQAYNNTSSNLTITYSDLQGGCPAESTCANIIDVDPQFVNPPAGDLRLERNSPAIDAGDNTRVPPDTHDLDSDGDNSEPLPYDLAGNPRFIDVTDIPDTGNGIAPIVDLGAYENQPVLCPAGGVLYVNKDAVGLETGASWSDAFVTLQDSLHVIEDCEIWVAGGSYYPDEGEGYADNDRTTTFQLKTGVVIYGGFAGTETAREERDWAANITVLSGDIDGNDITDPTGVVTTTTGITGTNSYHVVTGSGTDGSAVLDGFTVTGGSAIGDYDDSQGGGIYIFIGNPALTNITFSGNQASQGGGMYNYTSSPNLTNVIFSGNHGNLGGGMFNQYDSSPSLTNVTFRSNIADNVGGGIYNQFGSSPSLTNVTFSGNKSSGHGGGMLNEINCSPSLANVTFSGNQALLYGGGMYNTSSSNPTLTNVTFSGNQAAIGGGGIYNTASSSPMLQNSILWANAAGASPQIYNDGSSIPTIRFSLVEGCNPGGAWDSACGADGGYNLPDADPLFVAPEPASSAPTTAGNYRLQDASPAINAGDNTADLDGTGPLTATISNLTQDLGSNPRFVRVFVDLGAYENQTFPCPAGDLLYVDQDATGAQTGASWVDALTTLQDALQVTDACEIWVAEGVYYPDEGGSQADNNRAVSFALKTGVAIYGGFAGTETAREQRDWAANTTVLSGDIDGNDITNPTGVVTDTANITGTNSYHVVTGSGVTETAVLDGFFITAGQANGSGPSDEECNGHYCGGGMYNDNSSPTLTNITFSGNSAEHNGGGMYNTHSSPTLNTVTFSSNLSVAWDGGGMFNSDSSPALTNVAFYDNRAKFFGGGIGNQPNNNSTLTNVTFSGNQATYGGGMSNRDFSNPKLTNVTFYDNLGYDQGGGMYNFNQSSPTLTNVVFSGNQSPSGGGMNNYAGCTPSLTNVTFSDNQAINGGGMYNNTSAVVLTQVLFSGNKGVNGGAMHNFQSSVTMTNITIAGNLATGKGGGIYNDGSDPYIQNTLIWGNQSGSGGDNLFNSEFSGPTIRFSLVQGCKPGGVWNSACGADGGNNLPDADPLFVAPEPASSAPTTAGDYRLQDTSPAINAGDNTADLDGTGPLTATIRSITQDLDGNPRFVRVFVDLGAYENQTLPCPVGGILFVDRDAAGLQTGSSWNEAFVTLQDALQVSEACEIWAAEGVYYPDEGGSQADNDRTATFQLKTGVGVYGGFAGTETNREERDWEANVTVLSGDIDANDITDPTGVVTTTTAITGTNSIHVVNASDTSRSAVLDGFTITGGNADGINDAGTGGGLFCKFCSPVLAHLTFIGNSAANDGGGMYTNMTGFSVLMDVVFDSNAAANGGGMFSSYSTPSLDHVLFTHNLASNVGGGMFTWMSSSTLTDTTFTSNQAISGGGMFNGSSSPTLTDTTFISNQASTGGGMYNYYSSPTLTDTTFTSNQALVGGGMYNSESSSPTLTNVIFVGNIATSEGGGMYNWYSSPTLTGVTFTSNQGGVGGGMGSFSSSPKLTNVIFVGNVGSLGGGMANWPNSIPQLTNVVFSGNMAGFGGGMWNYYSYPILTNVTISGNTSPNSGGGMFNSGSNPILQNSILWGNTASVDPQIHNENVSNALILFSLVDGCNPGGSWNSACGTDGGNNLPDADPLFVDMAGGDLRLSPGSPAIDAGNNAYITTTLDLAGGPRFVDIPAAPDTGLGTPPLVDLGAYEANFVDAGILKTVYPLDAVPGQTITYTLAFSNGGSLLAAGVIITDVVPAFMTIQTVSYGGVAITETGHIPPFVWAVQDLAAGQGGVITLTAILSEPLTAGVYTNTAIISAEDDAGIGNNLSAAGIHVLNVAPLAQNNSYFTLEDTPLHVSVPGVLGNDGDANGDTLSALKNSSPAYGVLVLNLDGSFVYTPTLNANGPDSFTYHASDGALDSNIATVSLTITSVNDAPLGTDKTVTTLEDTDYTFTAADFGFTDPNDSPANAFNRVKITTLPGQGTLKLNGVLVTVGQFVAVTDITANLLVFTPAPDANGAPYASFTFQVEDDGGTANDGVNLDPTPNILTINVSSVNDPPVAVADAYTTNEGTQLAVAAPGVLGNDTDLDSDPLTTILDSGSTHGLLALSLDGSFVYTPTLNYYGLDSFTYHASDGALGSNVVTVTIAVNASPIVEAGPDQSANEGGQVVFTGSFTDPGNLSTYNLAAVDILWDFGDGFTATGTLNPTHTYADNGTFTVTLTVTDSLGAPGSDSLLVTVVNVAPSLPMLPNLTVLPGETVTLTVDFSDPGWLDTHTVMIEWLPGQTQVLDLAAGVLEFTASRAFSQEGNYLVTVTVIDKDGGSSSQSFTVDVKYFRVFMPLVYVKTVP